MIIQRRGRLAGWSRSPGRDRGRRWCRSTESIAHEAGDDDAAGPELSSYGSREWMIAFVSNPKHDRFYRGRNDRMPAFGEEKMLTDQEIGLVVDWLRGEWYEPEFSRTGR